MSNTPMKLKVEHFHASENTNSLADYCVLVAKTIASPEGKNIKWRTHAELLEPHVFLVTVRIKSSSPDNHRLIAGMYTMIEAGSPPMLHLGGCVTDSSYRNTGAMRLAVEEAIIGTIEREEQMMKIVCEVRAYPNNQMNELARRLFRSYKMREKGVSTFPIMSRHDDIHLNHSREYDGGFRALELEGNEATYRAARRRRDMRLRKLQPLILTAPPVNLAPPQQI